MVFQPLHGPTELDGEQRDSGGHGQNVSRRLRQKNAGGLLERQDIGQKIDKGNQQKDLSQQGQKQGAFGITDGYKGLLAANLYTQQTDSGGVNPQRRTGHFHQGRSIVENLDKDIRETLDRKSVV